MKEYPFEERTIGHILEDKARTIGEKVFCLHGTGFPEIVSVKLYCSKNSTWQVLISRHSLFAMMLPKP